MLNNVCSPAINIPAKHKTITVSIFRKQWQRLKQAASNYSPNEQTGVLSFQKHIMINKLLHAALFETRILHAKRASKHIIFVI